MSTGTFHRLMRTQALAPGDHEAAEAGGWQLVVANVGGRFHALEDQCSHSGVRLSDGWVDGAEIHCPLHGACFDLRDGTCLAAPATRDVKAFETRVADGYVEVKVDAEKP